MLAVESGSRLIDEAATHIVHGVPLEMVVKGSGRPLLFLHGMDGIEAAASVIESLAGHTCWPGLADRRLARTQPAEPPPTITWSNCIEGPIIEGSAVQQNHHYRLPAMCHAPLPSLIARQIRSGVAGISIWITP